MKKTILVRLLVTAALLTALAPITIRAASLNLYASVNGDSSGRNGNGDGSIFEYTPTGTQSTFASGLDHPRGLAVDSTGNLFAGTYNNVNGTVLKFTPGGVTSNFGGVGNLQPEGVVTDSAGNVYVMAVNESNPTFAGTIVKFTPGGARSTFGSTPGQSFGLAFNSAGNLFAADYTDKTIFEYTPGGTRSTFVSGSGVFGSNGPLGLAFNSAGNLFVSVNNGTSGGEILEFTPGGTESTFAATGVDLPRGLAFDSLDNLFVAELGNGTISEFSPLGVESTFATGVGNASGNGGPEYLTFGPARGPAGPNVPDSGSTFVLFAMTTSGLLWGRRMVKA
jgi:sugar lactone lactonase YvrE